MKRLFCLLLSVWILACSEKPPESPASHTADKAVVDVDKSVTSNAKSVADGDVTQYVEDVNYIVLKKPIKVDAGGVSVTEFFWYGCPHCRAFEPFLENWARTIPDNVILQKVPAVWSKPMSLHARAYYVGTEIQRAKELHVRLFDEIIALRKERDPVKHVAPLAKVFEEFGVPTEEFEARLNSPEISEQLKHAAELQRASQMHGTPALLVDGKYLVISKSVKGSVEVLKIVDFLIDKAKSGANTAL